MRVNDRTTTSDEDRDAIDDSSLSETVHVLVYHIDEQGYGLVLVDVERIVNAVAITPIADAPETILGIINVQGRVISVVNMRRKLCRPERDLELSDRFIIARTASRVVALVADSVEGVIACPRAEVITSEAIVPGLENLKGVVKLHDGIIMIHDLERFLFHEEEEGFDVQLGSN